MDKFKYTADTFKVDQAFQEADIVLSGKISLLGIAEPEGMGQVYFYNTEVQILAVEKGHLEGTSALICYQIISFKDMEKVPMPEVGKTYRFYISIREEGRTLKAFKITDL